MKPLPQELLLKVYYDQDMRPSWWIALALWCIRRSGLMESYPTLETVQTTLAMIEDWESEKELKRDVKELEEGLDYCGR